MITRTFINKCTTIFEDSEENFGLYPVGMLSYGRNVSRALINFDLDKIKGLIEDKTYLERSKTKHILRLTNCGSIDKKSFHKLINMKGESAEVKRASSFDIIVFRIPREWDAGVGFDSSLDFWVTGRGAVSEMGCNWYQSANGNMWGNSEGCDEGIYSRSTLSREYSKYASGNPDIVIARQHFDYGNENFEINITDFVNNVIDGKYKNYGLGLAFSPVLEDTEAQITQYIGFFSNNTNTAFKPVIETRYDGAISDDRYSFYLNKTNKLYLYSKINGEFENLDTLPTCSIDGIDQVLTVKQEGKGIYSVELKLLSKNVKADTIFYDTWSNLFFKGDSIDDVEMEFVTLKPDYYFGVGETIKNRKRLSVILNGINDEEKLNRGEKRIINAIFKEPFTHTDYELVENAQYRIYIKNGSSEIDIIDWDNIEKGALYNFFYIDTESLMPNTYYIDIRLKQGGEILVFKNELTFKVINNESGLKK